MADTTLQQLVEQALKAGGFDGLWNENGECACKIGDLFPCGQPSGECRAGYEKPCDCGEHDYHIAPPSEGPLTSKEKS